MNQLDLQNAAAALRGYAKWFRNHRYNPDKYHDPLPMMPNELERLAERLEQFATSLDR